MGTDPLSITLHEIRPDVAKDTVLLRGHVAGPAAQRHDLFVWARQGVHRRECTVDDRVHDDGSRAFHVLLPVVWPSRGLPTIEVVARAGHAVAAARRAMEPAEHPSNGVYATLELPQPGAVVTDDVVTIAGWCLFEGSATARVDAIVEGERSGPVRIHLERPDLVADWTHRDAPVSGFRERISLRNSNVTGDLTIAVEAESMDGRRWRSPSVTIQRTPEPPDPIAADYAAVLRGRVVDRLPDPSARRATGAPRVALVTHDLGYGGGQLWLSELIRQMQSTGAVRFELFSLGDGPLRSDLELSGVPVTVVEPAVVHSLARHEDRVRSWVDAFAGAGVDLVLVNTVIPFQAIEAAHVLSLPSLWAIHESFDVDVYCDTVWGRSIDLAVRDRFREALSLPQALLFEASETAALFAEWSRPEQRRLLDYGVDVDEIDAYLASFDRDGARAELGYSPEHTVVSVVGVFEGRKAEAAMVAVFEELAEVHPRLRLLLVGDHPSPYSDAVREQVRRSRHARRITIQGVTPDIARAYAVSDLLVCASDVESLPRSILEAMAFRLPVLSTAVFGVRTLIDDGRTGWLTPIGDFRQMASALHRVLRTDRGEWRRVAEAARAEVERRAGERSYGLVLAEVIHAIASGAPGALDSLPRCREVTHAGGR